MKDIRIAAVTFNSAVNRIRDNLEKMASWVKRAKNHEAQLICFPEMNVTGYSTKLDIKVCAESIPGPITEGLVQLALENQIVILAGMAEKDDKGRIFASHLVVTPENVSGVYRKIHIAPPERKVFSPGNSVPLFEIEGVKLGIQLCYDAHFPELSTRMAIDGADIIFMPHASPRGTPTQKLASWLRHLTARAFDNSVFIVACNQNGGNQKGLHFPGIAVVIDPSGDILEDNVGGKEAMIVANLKAEVLAAVRGHRMRYFLPNRRPELYR
ncbi:MAG: nitrilase-related carbon-nitrogen hydrolase [Desulfobacterales bacterium]|jgi:N-carbamoylputrescine amidase